MTTDLTQAAADYHRVEAAILYLEENFRDQPNLKTMADQAGLSEFHFQRIFSRWAGISPKRFLQYLTLEYTKSRLIADTHNTNGIVTNGQASLLDISYDAGLSGAGRLHDLFIHYEAMTPGEYKKQGAGLDIVYGFHATPFGECLLAITDRGICGLTFTQVDGQEQTLATLKANWSKANFTEDAAKTEPMIKTIFGAGDSTDNQTLNILLKGTPFQIKVWQALLDIPAGQLVSYQDVAAAIGQPKASQAVGNAVGRNHIGYLIPCHRVIRKVGEAGPYRWGAARKKAIIGWEAAQMAA